MGWMTESGDYCSFEKAVEHLGDRWSLLIIRELAMQGPRGFNSLADSLPGISRSVLVRRLRKLEDFGLIARETSLRPRLSPYRLAPAGEQLVPTLESLVQWADRWAPEDPAAAQHDPDVIGFWLTLRVDMRDLPDPPVVMVFAINGPRTREAWLVLQRGAAPSLCDEDPGLNPDRYLYVEADGDALYAISRGLRDWAAAITNRSVRLYGLPDLIRALPAWFLPANAEHAEPLASQFNSAGDSGRQRVPPANLAEAR
jgi:DNA-binding HxlR family transcriptional regulator